jgi:hypothetical protein
MGRRSCEQRAMARAFDADAKIVEHELLMRNPRTAATAW